MQIENLPISSSSHEDKFAEISTLSHILHFEICAREIREMFVCKHSETIEYVKNYPSF